MKHIKLANQVMEMLLKGEEEMLSLLRKQYEKVTIISEEDGEVGFFVNYQVNGMAIKSHHYKDTFQIGDVDGVVEGIAGAIGFVLYVKNGYLTMLEGYTNVIDKWPETDDKISLKYDKEPRDCILLKEKWLKD